MEKDSTQIEKLTSKEKWPTWKFQVRVCSAAQNLMIVVTGEEVKPDEPEENNLRAMKIKR